MPFPSPSIYSREYDFLITVKENVSSEIHCPLTKNCVIENVSNYVIIRFLHNVLIIYLDFQTDKECGSFQ